MKLQFTVKDQTIRARSGKIVDKTINYVDAYFSFLTTAWNDTRKFAHFVNGEEEYTVMLEDDKITQDMGFNLHAGDWNVYVHGNKSEDDEVVQRIVTDSCVISIEESAMHSVPFPEVTPDIAEQLVNKAITAIERAESAQNKAEEAQTSAKEAETGANNALASAIEAMNASAEAVRLSGEYAGVAGGYSDFANQAKEGAVNALNSIIELKSDIDKTYEKNVEIKESVDESKKSVDEAKNSVEDAQADVERKARRVEEIYNEIPTAKENAITEINTAKDNALSEINRDASIQRIENLENEVTEQKQDLEQLKGRVDNIDDVIIDTVEPLKKQIDDTDRSLEMLWKLNRGQTYDIEERVEEGHNESPSGAEYLTVEDVRGKTEQDSTNGYQLLSSKIVGKEEYGIKCVVNEDGLSGHISGTSTAMFNTDYEKFEAMILPAGTYTISTGLNSSDVLVQLLVSESEKTGYTSSIIGSTGITTRTVTTTKDYYARLRIQVRGANITVDTDFSIMLEKGSVEHEYEPYTGGIPSPSPDYPQEIHSVEEINVKVTGKNVLKPLVDLSPKTIYGITFTPRADGAIEIKGTSTSNAYFDIEVTKDIAKYNGMYLSLYANMPSGLNLRISKSNRVSIAQCNANYPRVIGDIENDGSDYYVAIRANIYTTFDAVVYPMISVKEPSSIADYASPEPHIERTITPPRPLNKVDEVVDVCDVEKGVWEYKNADVKVSDGKTVIKSANTDYDRYVVAMGDILGTNKALNLCSHMVNKNNVGALDKPYMFSIDTVSGGRFIFDYPVGTVSDLNTFKQISEEYSLLYAMINPTTEPIAELDLEFLRSLEFIPSGNNIIVTDQNGEDVEWLAEYIINLRKVGA